MSATYARTTELSIMKDPLKSEGLSLLLLLRLLMIIKECLEEKYTQESDLH